MAGRQIYVNLPVKDLDASVAFFKQLGFDFNPQFTNENATAMIVGEDSSVMLLTHAFFQGFTPGREIPDDRHAEVLIAISADSRAAVDTMIEQAEAAGGSEYREAQDHGWMYARAFTDLDGHIWEVLHSDPSKMPPEMQQNGGA